MGEFSKRVLKPAALPLAALGFIGVLVLAFSRILLAVPELGSTGLALLMSAEILGICGVLAATRRVKPAQRALLVAMGLAVIGGGVASAAIGVREIEPHGLKVDIAAEGIKFDKETLVVPADAPFEIEFVNRDADLHNVAIFADDSFAPPALFTGDQFPGVATKAYKIEEGFAAGTYAFRCDVHPTLMTGTVEATEDFVPGEEHEPAAPAETTEPTPTETETTEPGEPTVEVATSALAFDTERLELKAGVPTSIELTIPDSFPHNLAIYEEAGGDPLFQGEVLTTVPGSITYSLPAIEAGEYYFQCDVHPDQMNGTAVFE